MPGVAGGLLSLVDTSQIIRHFWSRYGSGKPDAPLKCTETIFPALPGARSAGLPSLAGRESCRDCKGQTLTPAASRSSEVIVPVRKSAAA